MSCPSCASGNQSEFPFEMLVHFACLENLSKTGIFLFPKILVCMDCGFLQYRVPASQLSLLAENHRRANVRKGEARPYGFLGAETVSE